MPTKIFDGIVSYRRISALGGIVAIALLAGCASTEEKTVANPDHLTVNIADGNLTGVYNPASFNAETVKQSLGLNCNGGKVATYSEAPGAYIVTADDDVYYPADWLEKLVAHADAGVVCHRAHRVTLGADGMPRSYGDWQRNIAAPDASALIFPTGVGGVLYAPGVFHPDVTNAALFQHLAPSADDVWLYFMHRLAGSRPAKIGGRFRITEWPGTQAQNLRGGNLVGDGNDRAVQAMVARYGFPG